MYFSAREKEGTKEKAEGEKNYQREKKRMRS